jgi:hypothetical protein
MVGAFAMTISKSQGNIIHGRKTTLFMVGHHQRVARQHFSWWDELRQKVWPMFEQALHAAPSYNPLNAIPTMTAKPTSRVGIQRYHPQNACTT